MQKIFIPCLVLYFTVMFYCYTNCQSNDDIKCKINWQRKADMPEARRNLKIVAVNDKIYALGGYAQPNKGREKGNYCYDISTDTWTIKSDMLVGRSNFAVATVNRNIYIIGGDRFLDDCEVYNPENDQWTILTPMPTPRQHINCAVIGNRIYIVGGRINWSENPLEAIINTHEVYDVQNDSWATLIPFPKIVENPSISVVNSKLYVIAGFDRSLYVYNPDENIWKEKSKIPSAYFIAGSTIIDDKIFVLDGVRPEENIARIFVYNTDDDSWSEATSFPLGVKLSGFTSVDNKLYVIGGCDQGFIANNYVYTGEIEE